MSCRMYENKYPDVDDLVMVNVRQIAENGAYVTLLEYGDIEGMILLTELSRRRIRSIQKLVRVGRNEVAVVMKIDKEKGYIDLSKRRVTEEDIAMCEERYNKSKAVHSIVRYVAEKQAMATEDAYALFCWPLYAKYGHAYDAFKLAIKESDTVFEGMELPGDLREEVLNVIRRRLTPQTIKFRADVEVTCFSYEGIDAIKTALMEAEKCQEGDIKVKVKLVAPPLYVLLTSSMDKQSGILLLEKAVNAIEDSIKKHSGNVIVKMKPRAITETDESQLAAMIAKAERENEEISGDEDVEEEEEEQ